MNIHCPPTTQSGLTKTIEVPYDQAVEKVREALKKEGFGVLSEIDIKAKLKEKIGVDFRRYVILGACNPPLAFKALQEELELGVHLPCNVIVYEADDTSKTVVSAVDAKAMLSLIGKNPVLEEVAEEVNERLLCVIKSL